MSTSGMSTLKVSRFGMYCIPVFLAAKKVACRVPLTFAHIVLYGQIYIDGDVLSTIRLCHRNKIKKDIKNCTFSQARNSNSGRETTKMTSLGNSKFFFNIGLCHRTHVSWQFRPSVRLSQSHACTVSK